MALTGLGIIVVILVVAVVAVGFLIRNSTDDPGAKRLQMQLNAHRQFRKNIVRLSTDNADVYPEMCRYINDEVAQLDEKLP